MASSIRTTLMLLLIGTTLALAYVSPEDQGLPRTVTRPLDSRRANRPKPEPLAPKRRVLGDDPFKRVTRGADTSSGSFSSSGSGSFAGGSGGGGSGGGYQGVSTGNNFGFAGAGVGGNPFPNYPFHNPNPYNIPQFDFNSFFQYLQQMQYAFQQNAINQGINGDHMNGPPALPAHVTLKNGTQIPIDIAISSYTATLPAVNGNNGGFGGGGGGYNGGGSGGGNFMGGQQGGFVDGATASASIGPQGGQGSVNLIPDVNTRFGADGGQFPAPSGGNYGVFTSSSSGTSDVNGHRTSFKTATTGVNDNGKITTFTVRDPPQRK